MKRSVENVISVNQNENSTSNRQQSLNHVKLLLSPGLNDLKCFDVFYKHFIKNCIKMAASVSVNTKLITPTVEQINADIITQVYKIY